MIVGAESQLWLIRLNAHLRVAVPADARGVLVAHAAVDILAVAAVNCARSAGLALRPDGLELAVPVHAEVMHVAVERPRAARVRTTVRRGALRQRLGDSQALGGTCLTCTPPSRLVRAALARPLIRLSASLH